MIAEEMAFPRNLHIEADKDDRAGPEQDGQINRLKPAVVSVVDSFRIERKPFAIRPLDEIDPVFFGTSPLVVVVLASVRTPLLATKAGASAVHIPPALVAGVKDSRIREQPISIVYRDDIHARAPRGDILG